MAQSNQEEAEPAPVGDALSAAAATLEDERQKHEKRCALSTPSRTIALRYAGSVYRMALNVRLQAMMTHAAGTLGKHLPCAGRHASTWR